MTLRCAPEDIWERMSLSIRVTGAYSHALDPLLTSTVTMLMRDINECRVVPRREEPHNDNNGNLPYYRCYHRFISRVSIIGFVVAYSSKTKYEALTVDDGTGTIHCRIWRKQRGNIAKRTIGDWVKIEGSLTSWFECVQLNVDRIDDVEDPKEELLHWLKSINVQQNVLRKPRRFPISPPITVSKASWKLLELLRSQFGIEGFSVNGLLKGESIGLDIRRLLSLKGDAPKEQNAAECKLKELIEELMTLRLLRAESGDK